MVSNGTSCNNYSTGCEACPSLHWVFAGDRLGVIHGDKIFRVFVVVDADTGLKVRAARARRWHAGANDGFWPHRAHTANDSVRRNQGRRPLTGSLEDDAKPPGFTRRASREHVFNGGVA